VTFKSIYKTRECDCKRQACEGRHAMEPSHQFEENIPNPNPNPQGQDK